MTVPFESSQPGGIEPKSRSGLNLAETHQALPLRLNITSRVQKMKSVRVNKAHDLKKIEGLVFFSERIKELLAHSTDDSFKVSGLNTRSRAVELERLVRHTYATTQRATALIPLFDELLDSTRLDPVLPLLGHKPLLIKIVEEVRNMVAQQKPRLLLDAADSLNAVAGLLVQYKNCAQDHLISVVKDHREKQVISLVSEIYVIELQSIGYSREHIRHASKKHLATKLSKADPINVDEILRLFFSEFSGDQKHFRVVTRCDINIPEGARSTSRFTYCDLPEGFAKLNQLEFENIGSSSGSGFGKYVVADDITAYDPFDARESFYRKINASNGVWQYLNHAPAAHYAHSCIVKDMASQSEIRIRKPINVMLRGQTQRSLKQIDTSRVNELISAIDNLKSPSKNSFISAVRLHKEALDSSSIQNQLIDLWASLEGFVPQTIDESPRIGTVLDHVLPAQTLIYAEKKFLYAAAGLANAGRDIEALVESVEIEGSFERKVAALILCDEYLPIAKKILSQASCSPLLRFLIFTLNATFRTRATTKAELLRHRKRLEWQLRRIYIARNTLMHSAITHANLDVLVENLHSYFDVLLGGVMRLAAVMGSNTSISAALKVIAATESSYLGSLDQAKNDKFTVDDFENVFFSSGNPLLSEL
ncbi:hypothetical protein bAD24_III05650 [Burkholderia sp. AD24]|nr:hypothetical protein bAD24_III05650 [Burkholderia sp. AD24]